MDMPPSGWYPDPYGVPDLLRWWDGSTWTPHTHPGNAPDLTGSAPATSLDATRIGSLPAATGRHAAQQPKSLQPTTVQPAVRPAEVTMADPAVIAGPGTAVAPTRVQPAEAPTQTSRMPPALQAAMGSVPQGANPSWPNGGPRPGAGSSWPSAGPGGQGADHGTQVLPPIDDATWGAPGGPGGYDTLGGRPGWDEARRRRMLGVGLLAGGTAVALALIALALTHLGSGPGTPTAAQTQPLPATTAPATTPSAQVSTTPTPTASTVASGVTDSVSGLSYSLLATPWSNGCPPALSNQQTLTWTAGESAQAGQFQNNGQQVAWYGEACSGPLTQQSGYNGVADLEPTATNLVNQFDGPYYGALNHQRTQLASTPVSVSGHPGWEIKYLETYPDAASMGLPFNSEEAAVVVVDQGTGLTPSVFFVSVPSSLGVTNVDALVSSLQLTVTQQPGQPSATPSSTDNGGGGGGGGGGGNNP